MDRCQIWNLHIFFVFLRAIEISPGGGSPKRDFLQFFAIFGNFWIFQKIGFLAYLIAPGVPGPLKSNLASENDPGDLSTASDRGIFIDFR